MLSFLSRFYRKPFTVSVEHDLRREKEAATPTNFIASGSGNGGVGQGLNDPCKEVPIAQERNDDEMKARSVTFHPAIVTGIYLRVSTSEEEKKDLYFSLSELRKCREEEARQEEEKARLMSVIQGQQKYQKCGGRQGHVTRVSLHLTT